MWLAVNHNTGVTSDNEVDVRSVLHGQVSLAAVNLCVIGEAIFTFSKQSFNESLEFCSRS